MEKATDAELQARAQLESVRDMAKGLQEARYADNYDDIENAEQAIQDDALDVQVRSDWHALGETRVQNAQYTILLCTGGPAVRIKGTLDDYQEPATAQLEYQDWGIPWTRLAGLTIEDVEALLVYAGCFYFAD